MSPSTTAALAPGAGEVRPAVAGAPWTRREDTWAIAIALAAVAGVTIAFFAGGARTVNAATFQVPAWSSARDLAAFAAPHGAALLGLFLVLAGAFSVGARAMGWPVRRFVAGFALLFAVGVLVTAAGSHAFARRWQLETPLLALAVGLVVGLVVGNLVPLPAWFHAALRTEYYVKTGIVLMGATLPFTLLLQAGPVAIAQATAVAVVTFTVIYLAATRLFGLDPRLAACLGAGGSICGVSAAIAIGGAARAEKGHVSVAISLVVVWAVAMVFLLPAAVHALGLAPGPAGAWIGTSEFADAAGFAAAAALGDERAVKTFTLMKVVGRDMFVGVWALVVAVLSVTVWERRAAAAQGAVERVGIGEIWRRFPKFVLGFLLASLAVTAVVANLDPARAAAFGKGALAPLKALRGWAFVFTFLAIGFTTRLRELTRFGWRPFVAFALGVLVNVPLGLWLSGHLLASYWSSVR